VSTPARRTTGDELLDLILRYGEACAAGASAEARGDSDAVQAAQTQVVLVLSDIMTLRQQELGDPLPDAITEGRRRGDPGA
jgi:hypothetical protein